MKIYAFEDIDAALSLLPLAARRALDIAGLKVSLASWQLLPLEVRRELVALGSAPSVNAVLVRDLLEAAHADWTSIEPVQEPSAETIPASVQSKLGAGSRIVVSSWIALEPLDRYALDKVARRGREERWLRVYDEIIGASGTSSHLTPEGDVRMVAVSGKQATLRRALAESCVVMSEEAFRALQTNRTEKGDVLATARVAGIMAAKRTADIIPLCHPLTLTHCEVELSLVTVEHKVAVRAAVEVVARTGVEMEAMVAASAAALTVYDMLKGLDRAMVVGPTRLLEKSGGKSGDFRR